MSKKFYPFWMALIVTISLSTSMSAQTTTLDISSSPLWTDSITGNPSSCEGGGFWSDTYGNNTGFNIGSFKFTHNSGFDIYSYWGGFTTGANGDLRCYSSNCPSQVCGGSGSWGWVTNQWGVMAGGGLSSTSPITATKGEPYLIGYWDYFSDGINPNAKSLQVKLNGDSLFNPQEIYICNHPWPYYGNIYGDGFARPLNQPGDYFKLIIHAVYADNSEGSIVVDLAVYDDDDEILLQSDEWKYVSLTGLGSNVKSLYFTMESTDELVIGDVNYGPNTAVYFCMDKLKVTKTGGVATKTSTNVQRTEKVVNTAKAVKITDYFPVKSYSGGSVIVYDTNGNEVLKTTVKAGEKINVSQLPVGEYSLQHGNKIIPIIKKGGIK